MAAYFNRVEIGPATLYHGDCASIMPSLGPIDLILTDPPYGIGEARGKNKSRCKLAVAKDYGISGWDDKPAPSWIIDMIRSISNTQIIFGGNYYSLPPSSCWLVWDKDNGSSDFADCELAWTNMNKAVRRLRFRWAGMLQENMGAKETRVHPTQKPIPLMRWALSQADDVRTVCDPFMGSGTTGIASIELGKKFIGIELDENHFNSAVKRIELAVKESESRLFSEC